MSVAAQTPLVLADEDMAEALILPFAGGSAAVFSSRAPDKAGPNEDAAGLLPVASGVGALAVADGLGGQPGGENASKIAIRCLRNALEQAARDDRPVRSAILDGVERANERVLGLGIGAATTFAALEVSRGDLRPYHVGDSGILVVGQRGKIKLQTVAHSPVGYALEAGLLNEREALHHDQRHEISNMVGAADMRIEVGSPLRLAPRDTALVASDGLFDNLSCREVVDIIRAGPLERVARTLVRRCKQRMCSPTDGRPSKPDDLTFVLYRPGDQARARTKVPALGSRRPHQGQ